MDEIKMEREIKEMLHQCADELHAPDSMQARVKFALNNAPARKRHLWSKRFVAVAAVAAIAVTGAFAAGGIEQGFQLVQRCFCRGLFLCKAVRVEAHEHGPVDSFSVQFFHKSISVSFLQIATSMKKVRTDTRCGLSSYFRPYFLLKRSTRPPVSTSFCLPV